jgi:hypothetical protein
MLLVVVTQWREVDTSLRSKGDSSLKIKQLIFVLWKLLNVINYIRASIVWGLDTEIIVYSSTVMIIFNLSELHNQQQTILCHLCPSWTFRPLPVHHQGDIYKCISEQQILSEMCLCVCWVTIQYW